MPKVVNLRETKGKVPAGAILIDRRTKWGNPYTVKVFGRDLCLKLYENTVQGIWSPTVFVDWRTNELLPVAYEKHHQWAQKHRLESVRSELAGKDLACWCAPLPCHGDILLKLANPSLAKERPCP